MLAQVASVSGQTAPPAFFSYQTGGWYANASNSIAQAQLEFALATPGVFMVAPSYPVTEKNGHLDANGYRWLGAQFGKAMHRVLTLGQDFVPLHPLRATLAGRRLRIAFHVPAPPLVLGRPFAGHRFVDPPDGGFALYDEAGGLALTDLALSGPDAIELTLARDPVGALRLHYADKTVGGRGALRDSDAETAPDAYVYDPASGHYASANHPELNGRPYPLHNWCVAFAIPVQVLAVAAAPKAPAPTSAAPPAAPAAVRQPARVTAWDVLTMAEPPTTAAPPAPPRGVLSRILGVFRRE
jgi:hypothetical protein